MQKSKFTSCPPGQSAAVGLQIVNTTTSTLKIGLSYHQRTPFTMQRSFMIITGPSDTGLQKDQRGNCPPPPDFGSNVINTFFQLSKLQQAASRPNHTSYRKSYIYEFVQNSLHCNIGIQPQRLWRLLKVKNNTATTAPYLQFQNQDIKVFISSILQASLSNLKFICYQLFHQIFRTSYGPESKLFFQLEAQDAFLFAYLIQENGDFLGKSKPQ